MRLFKTLLHCCLHDLKKNVKQFIAIIFIIGIAVTLFSGLVANSIQLETRVNEVYSPENGNLADIWLTIAPELGDDGKNDLTKIESIIGKKSEYETRTLMPSTIGGISSSTLIYLDRPTINKEYDTSYDYTKNLSKDFFFIDEELVSRYSIYNTDINIQVGDSIEVGFDSETIKTLKDNLLDDPDQLVTTIDEFVDDSSLNVLQKEIVKQYVSKNIDSIIDTVDSLFDTIFNENTVSLSIEISGIMKHPENIQSATFSQSNAILSARTLLNSIIDKVSTNIDYENVYNFVNDSTIDDTIKQEILETLVENKTYFKALVYTYSEKVKDNIMGEESEEYVDSFKGLYNQIVIKLEEGKDLNAIMDQLQAYYNNKNNTSTSLTAIMDASNYPSNAIIQNDIVQSRNLAYCFPLIFCVVAVLVVLTTISQMMLKQRIQIGTLKAIGVDRKHILLYYLCYMNAISLLGVIVGLIIGPLLLPAVMNIKYEILYSLPAMGYSFPFLAGFLIFIVVIAFVSLVTYLIIRKELSYMPNESMRPLVPKMKFKNISKEVKNTSLMMALRNIKVHLSRSIMVIIGVMGCTGLLICGMGIEDTINYGKDKDLDSYLDCDYVITYSSGAKRGSMVDTLLKYDEIELVEEYSQLRGTISFNNNNTDSYIFYFSKDSKVFKYDNDLPEGHWDINKVGLSESIATSLGAKVGDTVSFIYNGNKYEKEIAMIFYTFANNSLFIYHETIEESGDPELTSSSNFAWIRLKTDSNGNKVVNPDDFALTLRKTSGVSTVATEQDNIERIESYMSSIKTMTNTVKLFALLLAVVVLINLAILNFQERARDIATLKVLGFSKFEIARSLIYEVMILTFFGALLGMGLGFPLEYLVLATNITPLISYAYVIYWYTYLIAFAISIVTSLLVNIIISYRIDKINMAESLKSVE